MFKPWLRSGKTSLLCKKWKFSGCQEAVGSWVFSSVWHSALFPSALWPRWPHRRLFLSLGASRTPSSKNTAFMSLHRCWQWMCLYTLVSSYRTERERLERMSTFSSIFPFAFASTAWLTYFFLFLFYTILVNWSTSYINLKACPEFGIIAARSGRDMTWKSKPIEIIQPVDIF